MREGKWKQAFVIIVVGDALCLQQPGRGHPRFPGSQGGFSCGPCPSSNLILIQTEPMEEDAGLTQQPSTTEHTGPRSQLLPSSSATPSVLLRPQDKWESKDTTKAKCMLHLKSLFLPFLTVSAVVIVVLMYSSLIPADILLRE